ncbi:MAG TPA: PKD domain-containing protein [Deltaproteobacteria bacterium]|nr:PKD domain-containing protein [Deltaproteobacteria bacterium]HPW70106.1 PKD domain-containing protein [Deltaproteobacteria bacterium]HRV36342.1 PKD domain-containing protein [Desulfomonilia bacterium]
MRNRSFRSYLEILLIAGVAGLIFSCSSGGGSGGGSEGEPEETAPALTASITSPAYKTVQTGTAVIFMGSVSGGVKPYTYHWDFDGAAEPSDLQNPREVIFNENRIHTVTFTVHDSAKNMARDSMSITVTAGQQDDQNFNASILSPSKDISVEIGKSCDFKAAVSGGTGPFTFNWNFAGAARPVTTEGDTPPEQTITFNKLGTYQVTFSALDSRDNAADATVNVTVADYVDTPPVIQFISPQNNTVISPGDSLEFQIKMLGGNAPFTFDLTFPDGVARNYHLENATEPPCPSVTFNKSGTHEVVLTATDIDGETGSASVIVRVQ